MKKVMIIGLLMLGVLMTAQTNGDKAYVEVTGKSERFVIPDQIYLTVELRKEKVDDFKKLEKKTMSALKKAGVSDDKITMANAEGDNVSVWFKKGFETRKNLWVEVSTAQMVNEVMMALHDIGVHGVRIAQVDYSQKEALQDELRVEAMKDAKRKSELMLGAVDAEIGKPLMVRENQWGSGPLPAPRLASHVMMADAEVSKKEAEVSFKKLNYKSEIFVRFEIKD